jgi:hypothetical protein
MKNLYSLTLGLIAFGCSHTVYADQVLLSDTFGGTSLDTSNFQALTPVAGASVAVNNGLILTDGGAVLTLSGFSNDIQIDLGFEFTGTQFDSFKIFFGTTGDITNNSGVFDEGLFASFRMMSDPTDPAGTNDNVSLYYDDYPTTSGLFGSSTFAMTTDTLYNIRIDEIGSNISLYVDDFTTPILTATTTDSFGELIGLENRQGAASGSSISEGSQVTVDYLTVTGVPDAGSTILELGLSISLLGLFYRHNKSSGIRTIQA